MEQQEIREIIKKILDEELDLRIARITAGQEDEFNRLAVLQRLVHLEEELKAQRKLMEKQFEAIERRFEAIDKRFEAVDKRFEAVDKRFEAVDKRFEDLYRYLNVRFEAIDKRFEAMDKRFEDLIHYVDRRFTQLTWLISTMFVVLGTLITVFRFLG